MLLGNNFFFQRIRSSGRDVISQVRKRLQDKNDKVTLYKQLMLKEKLEIGEQTWLYIADTDY